MTDNKIIKLSQLIHKAQNALEEFGDLPVVINSQEFNVTNHNVLDILYDNTNFSLYDF